MSGSLATYTGLARAQQATQHGAPRAVPLRPDMAPPDLVELGAAATAAAHALHGLAALLPFIAPPAAREGGGGGAAAKDRARGAPEVPAPVAAVACEAALAAWRRAEAALRPVVAPGGGAVSLLAIVEGGALLPAACALLQVARRGCACARQLLRPLPAWPRPARARMQLLARAPRLVCCTRPFTRAISGARLTAPARGLTPSGPPAAG